MTREPLRGGGGPGAPAPYTQTAQAAGVAAGAELVLHPNKAATAEQRAAARAALLALTGSGDGSVTIVADGTKPAIDLPVSVEVLLDGRVDALESALQGDGSYTSKYSGEEIDQLLDTIAAQ